MTDRFKVHTSSQIPLKNSTNSNKLFSLRINNKYALISTVPPAMPQVPPPPPQGVPPQPPPDAPQPPPDAPQPPPQGAPQSQSDGQEDDDGDDQNNEDDQDEQNDQQDQQEEQQPPPAQQKQQQQKQYQVIRCKNDAQSVKTQIILFFRILQA